ncbi:DNA primase [Deinococcus peraridilitoris]|uniref:DNA primase n=1 Tax=Deinococcus peraridilitoris (strain DSM 19664 / LMG 22246 / CIP 109416 / KR-200) TaxID=937777 RepID=K9ZX63_DEIPD|nr:DNA primase [Deinococcus peraridilitoris]AFZ66146.1 DNA primase, catalytic core [Deinococcus peraridilitoris DSM 19664]
MGSKEEIRAKLSIADLVGDYVQLTPVGQGRFKGLCPFHKEKTPSFQVDATQGYFYCFGCKAGGDAFSFLMRVENLQFGDAMKKLAARAGITLEATYGERASRDLYDVNAFALEYFREHLPGVGTDYFQRRGLTEQTIEHFELGYAPGEWDGLLKRAKARGISERQLLDAGLLSENAETGRLYDRFRGRVMFPIRDHLGRLVGFGGRVLGDEKPKYLNTPETEVFKKGELLYGYDKARALAQKSGELVVVEGYMDVIAMHQHGFGTAVATLGTALTAEHATLLQRQEVRSLALLFDRDAAGQRATLAGLDQVIGSRFAVRALTVPDGKDPADTLLAGGTEILRGALAGGMDEVEYRVASALAQHDLSTTAGKRGILQTLLPRMQSQDPLDEVAERMRARVCEVLGIKPEALLEWIASKAKRKTLSDVQISGMQQQPDEQEGELRLLREILQNPQLLDKLDGLRAWRNETVRKVMLAARGTSSAEEIIASFDGQPEQQVLIRLLFEARTPGLIGRENARVFEEKVAESALRAGREIESKLTIDEMREELAMLKKQVMAAAPTEQMNLLRQIQELQRAVEAEKRSRKLQA